VRSAGGATQADAVTVGGQDVETGDVQIG